MPVWRGELYFENHRGTLTSQLRTKLGNKRCERLLRELELWTATQGTGDPSEHGLDELWQEVLTLQFHDILPGSSIAWVHADAEAAHARIGAELEARIARPPRARSPRPGRCWPTSPPTTATRWSSPTSRRTATGRPSGSPTGAPRSGPGCPAWGWRRRRRTTEPSGSSSPTAR